MRRNLAPVQIVVLSFIGVILIGAILLSLPFASKSGTSTNFLTSLFTSTSATCVTGLVVVDTFDHWTLFGQAIIILMVQIGGLGYMTIATFFLLFSGRRITLRQRFALKEGFNVYKLSGIVSLTRVVLFYVASLEFVGAVILTLRFLKEVNFPRALWMGLFHSVSSFCNSGFDIIGGFKSFTGFVNDVTINLVVMGLIVLGGIGFYVVAEVVSAIKEWLKEGTRRKFTLHTKIAFRFTLLLILLGAFVLLLIEWSNPNTLGALPIRGKILSAFFQSITPRTAGFNTLDIASLRPPSQLLIILLMFIGGSPGGTAGGVKTTTFFIFFMLILSSFKQQTYVTVMGRTFKLDTLRKAIFIITFAISVILFSTFLILINQGNEFTFMQVLFEVTSAFGTVGLTTGITPNLSNFSRVIIIVTMLFGRVGPLSFVLSIATRVKKKLPQLPEEEVAVG